jgi:hypothetical protein
MSAFGGQSGHCAGIVKATLLIRSSHSFRAQQAVLPHVLKDCILSEGS